MSYTDYPKSASNNARRALKYKEESGNPRGCGTPVGWRRATQLANREPISEDVVKRMASFNRHRQHKDVPYNEGCGGLMWDAWGGTSGVDWAIRKSKQIDEEKMLEAVSETKGVMDTLKKKAKEHNDDVGDVASKRTTASTLKKVYDRGIGAYRTNPQSVRPSVTSASQWAFARVNSFLYALRNGKYKSGKHDTDLLPSGHPMSSKSNNIMTNKNPDLAYFRTQEEAEEYAEFIGCTGTHTHTMDGETYYMACSTHERNIELEENRQGKNNMNSFITKRSGIVKDVDVERRMIEGYYSVFDFKDSDDDIMMPGAYTKTIKENGPNGKNRIMHLYQHDPLTVLGKPSMLVEDERGLFFRTAISDTQLGTDVLKLYRDGVLTEHSVGINFVQRDFSNEDEAYIVREVKMWEGSTVTWGANEMAKGGMAKSSMADQLDQYKKLSKAFYSGDYTDETFGLIEMHIKNFEESFVKSLQTMEAEPITSQEDEADLNEIFKQFNNQLQIEKEFQLWTSKKH